MGLIVFTVTDGIAKQDAVAGDFTTIRSAVNVFAAVSSRILFELVFSLIEQNRWARTVFSADLNAVEFVTWESHGCDSAIKDSAVAESGCSG